MSRKKSFKFLFLVIFGIQTVHAQRCKNNVLKTTPDGSFTIHDNGTVTHNSTGLMWMRCLLGQTWDGINCNGSATFYDWSSALQAAYDYFFAEYNDWRLPNKNELASIVEMACVSPSINSMVFPNDPSQFVWSSSPYFNGQNSSWYVEFGHGNVEGQHHNFSAKARLVRGGK